MPLNAGDMIGLAELDWAQVRGSYDQRKAVHRRAMVLLAGKKANAKLAFAELVLGVSDPAGNFSASRHALGERVLALNNNPVERIRDLAKRFTALKTAAKVPAMIRSAGLRYCQISVGSEVSCMVNPKVCWVANRRTIWAHLLWKHHGNTTKANQELALYRDDDTDSEMHYQNWGALHKELASSMPVLVERGAQAARSVGVAAGTLTYLWGDVVADGLYAEFHG